MTAAPTWGRFATTGQPRRTRGRKAFSLLETVLVVLLVGMLAAAVGWTTRSAFARSTAQATWSQLDWLDAAARRAAQSGTPAMLVFDLSEHWAGLSLDGAKPAGVYRVQLTKALQVTELWHGAQETFSGRVTFRASSQGVLPTYVLLAGPREATTENPSRWWVRAGGSGQRVEIADRYAAREVLNAMR